MQCRTTPKGQSLRQIRILKNSNKSPAYDQVLFNLGIGNPGCKLAPGDNIRFWNHRSPSTSVLIRSRQRVSFSASPAGNDGSSLVKDGFLSAIKRARSGTSAAWPDFSISQPSLCAQTRFPSAFTASISLAGSIDS